MRKFEKLVIITRKTALEELVERFNTVSQARFYVEHMGVSFEDYQLEHDRYAAALAALRALVPRDLRHQVVERSFLPGFTFGEADLVATLGPDGLVVNTAKYLDRQPILALNPDPSRIDGILNPIGVGEFLHTLGALGQGRARVARVSMARVRLNDGQELHAVNDLFVGPRSHTSARYTLTLAGESEHQLSSGIVVSTGAGSTGWYRSMITGALGIAGDLTAQRLAPPADSGRFDWEAPELRFCVREPFPGRTSSCRMVHGRLEAGQELVVTSACPEHGVIFSDGIESDYLAFGTGAIARIGLAERKAHLVQRA